MADEFSEEARQETVEEFLKLSLEEQRRRIHLRPAYLDVANEIVQPDRVTVQTSYFWRRWGPKLGPSAAVLLLRLRRSCAQLRDSSPGKSCFPTQDELVRDIGIDPKRLRLELRRLELLGFVRRKRSFRTDRRTGRISRCPDEYRVLMDDPVAPEDVAGLFARAGERIANGCALSQLEIVSPAEAVDSTGSAELAQPKRSIRPDTEAVDSTGRVLNALSTNVNVQQDRGQTRAGFSSIGDQSLFERLLRPNQRPEEILDSRAELALEIARELGDLHSLRFITTLTSKLPSEVVRQALSETMAAKREGRLRGRPGAFFTGAVRSLAKELGVQI